MLACARTPTSMGSKSLYALVIDRFNSNMVAFKPAPKMRDRCGIPGNSQWCIALACEFRSKLIEVRSERTWSQGVHLCRVRIVQGSHSKTSFDRQYGGVLRRLQLCKVIKFPEQ